MKRFSICLNLICLAVLFTVPVFAYIDPSVTTYAIQAAAGIVIAGGAAVGVLWRRAKKKAQEALHIDPNAKKETEADVCEILADENRDAHMGE